METVIEVLLQAGRSALDVALYTLLPIMIVMMILMRLLEVHGVLDRLVQIAAPLARPFGLTGLGVMAMIQISFVSFVAPVTTLALMDDRGEADRRLAATFAAVLAMAPANAVFPLAPLGLSTGLVQALSLAGGMVAAAATYWLFGRNLPGSATPISSFERKALLRPSFLSVVNVSGREAIDIVINIIPVLLVSLAVVFALQKVGAVEALAVALAPALHAIGVDPALILPTLTKFLAGSTALVGVVQHMTADGQLSADALNRSAGLLLHPLDLPGIGIFASSGKRLGKLLPRVLCGAAPGIIVRTIGTSIVF
jgi:spore maturation protein SpmB